MKEVDTKLEVFQVAEAVSLTFEHLDLVVDALDSTGGNPMVKVIENARSVCCQLVGKFDNELDSTGPGFLEPVGQIPLGIFIAFTIPKVPKRLFEDIGGI